MYFFQKKKKILEVTDKDEKFSTLKYINDETLQPLENEGEKSCEVGKSMGDTSLRIYFVSLYTRMYFFRVDVLFDARVYEYIQSPRSWWRACQEVKNMRNSHRLLLCASRAISQWIFLLFFSYLRLLLVILQNFYPHFFFLNLL